MIQRTISLMLLIALFSFPALGGQWKWSAINIDLIPDDTIPENQVLYNGRIWKNQFYLVKGDQFLFSKEFLPGSISMRGRSFSGVSLKYDLFRDEILTPISGGVIQINKEMIDSFSLIFESRKYDFIKLQEDSLNKSMVFFNVLYNGETSLLVRYTKKIDKLAVEGRYDQFYKISRVFLISGNELMQVSGKKDLFTFMEDKKAQVKEYMKSNGIRVSVKDPETFIPVVKYYNTLKH